MTCALLFAAQGTEIVPSSLMHMPRCVSHTGALLGQQCALSSQVTPFSNGQQSCHRHTRPNRLNEHEQELPAGHSVQAKMSHICVYRGHTHTHT